MGHKLLLADDSITIQRVIELTFAEEDVQVVAVGDGKHAIDRIQTDRPDIVLADVGMPERDGYEVAAFIKSNPQLAHIPVLLLTGAFEPIDESRARAVGCDGVLVKPFEPQMVINRVKDLLAGRRPGGSETSSSTTGQPAQAAPEARPAPSAEEPKIAGDSLEDYFDRLDAAFASLGSEAPAQAPASAAASTPQAAAAPSPSAPSAVGALRPATVEDFTNWDPDLTGDPARPAAVAAPAAVTQAPAPAAPPVPPVSVHVSVTAPPVAPAPAAPAAPAGAPVVHASPSLPAPSAPQISLHEAFAALLAAEHGQDISPAARRSPGVSSSQGAAEAPAPEVVDDIVRRVIDRLTNKDPDVRQTVVDVAERLVREEIDRIKRAAG